MKWRKCFGLFGNRSRSKSFTRRRRALRPTQPRVEVLEDRRVLSGVTVITHGWTFSIDDLPPPWNLLPLPPFVPSDQPVPDWAVEMGEAILDRADDTADGSDDGTLLVHDVTNGFWKESASAHRSYDPDEEIVVVFDWVRESDLGGFEGRDWLEAAADALFAALLEDFPSGTWGSSAEQSLFDLAIDAVDETLLNFHFIGHSRGTVLNALVTQRFHEYFPGMLIDHVTTLDPHPAYGGFDIDLLPIPPYYGDPWSDPGQRELPTFENVSFADNYYQQAEDYELDFEFDGVPVQGALNETLDQDALDAHGYQEIIEGAAHADVHLWYHGTIDQSNTANDGAKTIDSTVRADWYPNGEDVSIGFAYSRIASATNRPSVSGKTDPDDFDGTPVLETVFNGDFDSGDLLGALGFGDKIPGWGFHGGGGTGHIDNPFTRYVELDAGDTFRRHNPLYFPPDTIGVEYDYSLQSVDVLFPDDSLKVFVGDELIDTIPIRNTFGFRRNRQALFDFSHSGFADTLEFQLDGGLLVESQARIDNVELISAASPKLPDPFEPNDSIPDATVLGSEEKVTLPNLTIHVGDVDFFRVTAADTGKLIVNALFEHDAGDLNLQLRDSNGYVIASADSKDDNERLVIPVVGQQVYYVEVGGVDGAMNCYALEVENFPAPIPDGVFLHPDDDNGISSLDAVTDAVDPRVFVQADLRDFAQMGIPILSSLQADAAVTPGAAVEVFVNGVSQGFANAIAGSNDTLFLFQLSTNVLQNGLPIVGGTLNFVTAAVRIFDGQHDVAGAAAPASGRTQLSEPLQLRNVDTAAPRVKSVTVTSSTDFNLFDTKPTQPTQGPTPPVNSLTVEFTPTYDVVTNAVVPYEDIGATGTQIAFANPDDGATQVAIGFAFPFFGSEFNQVFVGTNGVLAFDSEVVSPANTDLTSDVTPSQPVIAPLWDDWDIDPAFVGRVFFETRGTPGVDERLIVQWKDVEHFDANGVDGTVDFAAVLFADGTIEFRYNDVLTGNAAEDNGISATVGIRDAEPTAVADGDVNQISFNQSAINNGQTIRFTSPVDPALATNPGHYSLVGDANGNVLIESVTFLAPNSVQLNFASPLPDDRFTLTISDGITDLAGNALDGESQAAAPGGVAQLPSGDGQPGGDFVARFTVDSRAELGVWSAGSVYLDTNGNSYFDPNNTDATNRDLAFTLGFATDHIFAGDFDGSGFDQIAAYRRRPAGFEWLINDDLFAPQLSIATNGAIGIPVAGDFNGIPADGDEVGVFTGTHWLFDTSNPKDFQLNTTVASGIRGLPIVGNFDGFGGEDLGAYNPNTNTFFLSLDSQGGGITNGALTTTFRIGSSFPFIGVRERPVAADMDGDGIDDIGLWVPDRSGVTPTDVAEWYFFVSGGESLANRVQGGSVHFTPTPFGNDIFARFGNQFALPIVGNFDPPVARVAASTPASSVNAGVDGTSLGPQHTPDENAVDQHAPTVATTDTQTRDANKTVVTSSESSSATTQDAVPETGTPLKSGEDGSVTRTDPEGDSTDDSLLVRVDSTNDPPVLSDAIADVFVFEDSPSSSVTLTGVFSDPDGDELTYAVQSNTNPGLVTTQFAHDTLTLSFAGNKYGNSQITVAATDAKGQSATTSFDVNVESVNDPPEVITTLNELIVPEDAVSDEVDLTDVFHDADGDQLVYQVAANTDPALVAARIEQRTLTLDYAEDAFGTSEIALRATDGMGGVAEDTLRVTVLPVNDEPREVHPLEDIEVQEDSPSVVVDLRHIFVDAESDALLYSVSGNTNSDLVTATADRDALTLDFGADRHGESQITIRATDAAGLSAETMLDVRVAAVNDPPMVIQPIDDILVNADATTVVSSLSDVFSDPEGDALSYSVTGNTDPSLVIPHVVGDELSLQIVPGAHGTSQLAVQATDSSGAAAVTTFEVRVDEITTESLEPTPPATDEIPADEQHEDNSAAVEVASDTRSAKGSVFQALLDSADTGFIRIDDVDLVATTNSAQRTQWPVIKLATPLPADESFIREQVASSFTRLSDQMLVADFGPGSGVSDSVEGVLVYGREGSRFRWLVDFTADGIVDRSSVEPTHFNGIGFPVAGNFDGLATNGDEVGLFNGKTWYFDTDHDFQLSDETAVTSQLVGYPLAGDFDGDGSDDLATWDFTRRTIGLSLSSHPLGGAEAAINNRTVRATHQLRLDSSGPLSVACDQVVAFDIDQDGVDDIGFWTPSQAGLGSTPLGTWHFVLANAEEMQSEVSADGANTNLTHESAAVHSGEVTAQIEDSLAEGESVGRGGTNSLMSPASGSDVIATASGRPAAGNVLSQNGVPPTAPVSQPTSRGESGQVEQSAAFPQPSSPVAPVFWSSSVFAQVPRLVAPVAPSAHRPDTMIFDDSSSPASPTARPAQPSVAQARQSLSPASTNERLGDPAASEQVHENEDANQNLPLSLLAEEEDDVVDANQITTDPPLDGAAAAMDIPAGVLLLASIGRWREAVLAYQDHSGLTYRAAHRTLCKLVPRELSRGDGLAWGTTIALIMLAAALLLL